MPISSWSKAEKEAFRTQHPTKYPVEQVNHNYPKANVKEFADLIFAADCPEYKGLVTIVRRPKGTSTMETVASVPAEEAGEWLSRMHVSANADYYITKAQFSKAQTWDSRNLFAINAIWIDVDAHSKTPSFAEAERVHSLLIHALPELAGIPVPNIIIYSGRGFHLVWLIEQCAATMAPAAIFPAVFAVFPSAARFLSAVLQAVFREPSTLPPIFSINSYVLFLPAMFCHLLRVLRHRVRQFVQVRNGQGQKIIQPCPQLYGQPDAGPVYDGGR